MTVKNISGQQGNVASTRVNESSGLNRAAKTQDSPIVAGAKLAQSQSTLPKGVDVSVSEGAKNRVAEQKRAKDLAMKAPDVREDRVEAIKAKMAAGTYQVDSDKIATGMMREAIMEHLTSDEKK